MINPAEAAHLVLSSLGRLPAERCKIADAAGRMLRTVIQADRDGPPFDRATLDGVCLRHADWAAGRREFSIVGTLAAGAPAGAPPPEGAAAEIMTGAAVPAPCDCVLRREDYETIDGKIRARDGAKLERGAGVHPRASDFRSGDALVQPGVVLSAREIAIAASCGRPEVEVTVQPKIAILTTGDELVDIEDAPQPHQIRRSNDLALRAALLALGFSKIELNHLPDNRQAISWNLERLLQQADVILITGGVSMGRFDYLPGVLDELGAKVKFHGVAQRPGKPMWFGTFERAGDFLHPEDTRVVAIFALPGNPVSSYVCFHRYARPALAVMSGLEAHPKTEYAVLTAPVRADATMTLFRPARLTPAPDGRLQAEPRAFNTSGDYAALAGTDGFVEIAPGVGEAPAGAAAPFYRWI